MYEIRKQKQKELQEKRWWSYALLAAGIFLFSEGCSLLPDNTGYAASAIFFGIILHSASAGKVFNRIFKTESNRIAKTILIICLLIISAISYLFDLKFILILLLNLASIILFAAICLLYSKFKNRQE